MDSCNKQYITQSEGKKETNFCTRNSDVSEAGCICTYIIVLQNHIAKNMQRIHKNNSDKKIKTHLWPIIYHVM